MMNERSRDDKQSEGMTGKELIEMLKQQPIYKCPADCSCRYCYSFLRKAKI